MKQNNGPQIDQNKDFISQEGVNLLHVFQWYLYKKNWWIREN